MPDLEPQRYKNYVFLQTLSHVEVKRHVHPDRYGLATVL